MTHQQFTWTKPSHSHPEIAIYHLVGLFTGGKDGYDLLEEVRAELTAGAKGVVLNLEGVPRLSSAGVGIIAASFTSARNVGAGMRLSGLSSQARQILTMVGVLGLVGEAPSDDAAVAELMSEDTRR